MKRMILTSVFVLLALGVQAQNFRDAWSLTRCIEYALEHNLSVRQGDINVKQQEISLNTSENRRLPDLSSSASQNFSFGRGLTEDNTYSNSNTTSTSFGLNSSLAVFNGFQIKNNIEKSKLNLEAATAELDKVKDDIRVAVAKAYVQILYDMEILDVACNQVSIDSLQVVRLSEMAEGGKASRAEVSAQEATLAQSIVSVTQAQNNLSLAVLDLTQLLELPSPEGFTVVRPSADEIKGGLLMNPEEIYAEAVSARPVIKAEEFRLGSASKEIDLAKGAFLPSLSLSGGLGSNFNTMSGIDHKPFFDQLSTKFSQYVSLSLNIPIFSRFSSRNQLRSAQLSFANQEIQLENAKKQLYKEIQQAYYNAVAAQGKLTSNEYAAQSAKDALELVQAKYENGKAAITEFNEAKGRLISAESNLAQARYEYLYMSRLLDFYRGGSIVF